MPRKGPAVRRETQPDPIYQNPLVTQLINKILLHGKKSGSEQIVYKALEIISERTANDPVITLKKAVENVRPLLEVKSRRVGGATYQVPVEVRPQRGTTLALRWVVNFSRTSAGIASMGKFRMTVRPLPGALHSKRTIRSPMMGEDRNAASMAA